jgi:hypothetical protein
MQAESRKENKLPEIQIGGIDKPFPILTKEVTCDCMVKILV